MVIQHLRRLRATLSTNPSLGAVIFEGFCARLGFGVITFALPFFALSLGMSFTEIGILASLRLVAAILIKPMMGLATDRYGKKRVYVWSIVGRCVVGVLFMVATQPWALFAVRILHGVTTAARDPSSAVLIAEHADEDRMASSFAWYITAKEVGASLGYLIAGVALTATHDNYSLVFALAVITSLISLAPVWHLVQEYRPVTQRPGTDRDIAEDRAAPSWPQYALWVLLIATTGSMVNNLFPIIASEQSGLSKAQISAIFTVSTLAVAFAGPILGWVSDRVSRTIVLSLRSVANSVSSILYVVLPGFWGLGAARLVDDLGKAAFKPSWGSVMAEVSRQGNRNRRGKVIGYMDTAQSTGDAFGPMIAGLLWDHFGLYWTFGVRLTISITAEIYAIWLIRSTTEPHAAPQNGSSASPALLQVQAGAARTTGDGQQ